VNGTIVETRANNHKRVQVTDVCDVIGEEWFLTEAIWDQSAGVSLTTLPREAERNAHLMKNEGNRAECCRGIQDTVRCPSVPVSMALTSSSRLGTRSKSRAGAPALNQPHAKTNGLSRHGTKGCAGGPLHHVFVASEAPANGRLDHSFGARRAL
jgi:hypothetical protein